MSPAESDEAAVAAVGNDPFAAVLDRQSGEIGVRNQRTNRSTVSAQPNEDVPMSGAGMHWDAAGMRSHQDNEL
jgi:hypothetical protein